FHYFSQVSEGIIVIPRGFSGGENQCASAWKKEVRYFAGTTTYSQPAEDAIENTTLLEVIGNHWELDGGA
ncbi:MAG: hypothetical protein LBU11_08545, partial [Zoogloeaceae bacterium]|nr:hypothetical protein [Zoogloeaceae bacterium]